MRANKDRPTMSVVMMDDPVLVLAERENLITPFSSLELSNFADVKPEARPRDGVWANWCQPMASMAYNPQAAVPLIAAASLATGKPLSDVCRKPMRALRS